jgi:hypothetical protein
MSHLDAATLERIPSLNKKFYIPNNAVLIVAEKNDQAKE